MSAKHAALDAASIERKARLAKLASLKRKQPEPDSGSVDFPEGSLTADTAAGEPDSASSVATTYLSGRNYDPEARGPKLGFEAAPTEGATTLEDLANDIAEKAREQAAKEQEEAEKSGIDLFKLQPKKPNWDLKRDLDKKMEILNVRTQNAIARLVRERIQEAKKEAETKVSPNRERDAAPGSEEVGIEGNALVEGIHQREQEEQEEEQREKELDEEGPI